MLKNFSVDTIRFVIPSTLQLEKDLFTNFPIASYFSKFNAEGILIKDFSRFRLIPEEEQYGQKSYASEVTFTRVEEGILFEFSIPKFKWGHNSLLCWDLIGFLNNFRNVLSEYTSTSISRVEDWILKRIDICYSFVFENYGAVRNTLDYLAQCRFRGKPSHRRGEPYWPYQNRTLKFYSKFEEMKAHKDNYHCHFDIIRANSKCLFRFEEEWRSPYLMRLLRKKGYRIRTRRDVTIGKFCVSMHDYSWQKHIERYLKEMDIRKPVTDPIEAIKLIKSSMRKHTVYIEFLLLVSSVGVELAKDRVGKRNYYNYKRKLQEIGIDISVYAEARDAKIKEIQGARIAPDTLVNATDEEAEFYEEMMNKYGMKKDDVDRIVFLGSPQWKRLRVKYSEEADHNDKMHELPVEK